MPCESVAVAAAAGSAHALAAGVVRAGAAHHVPTHSAVVAPPQHRKTCAAYVASRHFGVGNPERIPIAHAMSESGPDVCQPLARAQTVLDLENQIVNLRLVFDVGQFWRRMSAPAIRRSHRQFPRLVVLPLMFVYERHFAQGACHMQCLAFDLAPVCCQRMALDSLQIQRQGRIIIAELQLELGDVEAAHRAVLRAKKGHAYVHFARAPR